MNDSIITINLNEVVRQFYPGLTEDEVSTIASKMDDYFDYDSMYTNFYEYIPEIARKSFINVDGKEGVLL